SRCFWYTCWASSSLSASNLQYSLFSYLSQVLPPAAFPLVFQTLNEIVKNSGAGKLTLGIVLALWSGAGGMSSLMSGLNTAYHVRESRSWIKVRLIALGLTLAPSVVVVAALFAVLLSGHVANRGRGSSGRSRSLFSQLLMLWSIISAPISRNSTGTGDWGKNNRQIGRAQV